MRNKIIAFIITLLIMIGLVAGWYLLLYKKSPSTQTTSQSQPTVTKVSDDAVISPVVTFDKSGVWYFNSSGQLFRRDLASGDMTEFSFNNPVPDGFHQALWPAQGTDFILFAGHKYLYDNTAKEFKQLPDNIQSLDYFPDGKRIAYIWKSSDGKSQSLFTANSDATGFTKVKDVFWSDLVVKVSPDGKYALLVRSSIQDVNKIYRVNLITGQFDTIVSDGKNVEVRWISPTKFLYVSIVSNQYSLQMYDLVGGKSTSLGINATLDRVVVSPDGMYLYADVADGDSNSIAKLDLNTLQSTGIYHFDTSMTPRNLMLANNTILFVNSQDNKLYKLTQ